jgi:hypothetical protein
MNLALKMSLFAVSLLLVVSVVLGATQALDKYGFIGPPIPRHNDLNPVYEYYGGVGVFIRGIHMIATDQNPLEYETDFKTSNDYWKFLKEKETVKASQKDFISIIIARGDHPTGGYMIQVKSFSWLESYPVKLRFEVNLTNPGEGVGVTEAFTNPLTLITIGKLDPGEYIVEVHIDTYILTFDSQGKPVYTLLLTFKEELWTLKFTVE